MAERPAVEHRVGLANTLLIALLVILPTVFGWFGKTAEMGVIIVACSLALCFANLHKIESFKGAGFEARMRKAVEEAYATLERVQELVRPVARSNIANVAYGDRWDSVDRETAHQLMAELSGLVPSLELQADLKIQKMVADFYNLHANDHLRFLLQVMRHAHIKNDNVQERLNAMMLVRLKDDFVPPTVETVRGVIAELSVEQRTILEPFLLDYEHYIKTHTYRRVEADSVDHLPTFPVSAAAPIVS